MGSTTALSSAELAELMASFNEATGRLQATHERLEQEVVRLRGELSTANEQLERARRLAALGEMAAGIAHEVRNPLGSIGLYARMLEQDLDDRPAQCATVRKIAQAVRGLNGIVGDVLDFARTITVRARWIEVESLIERAVQSADPSSLAPGVRVVRCGAESGGDAPAIGRLWGDEGLLAQVLINLIRNAAEAIRDHDAEGCAAGRCGLVIAASSDETGAGTLQIGDDGPGVPKDVLDRLFNPFFTTRASGTGLGLAIVHRIVDAHGGAIRLVPMVSRVHERLGVRGAVFEVTLPGPGVEMDQIGLDGELGGVMVGAGTQERRA